MKPFIIFLFFIFVFFLPSCVQGADDVVALQAQIASLTRLVDKLGQRVEQLEMERTKEVQHSPVLAPAPATSAKPSTTATGGGLSEAEKAAMEAEFAGTMGGAKPAQAPLS
ncbi:MAG: hypothetical protein HQM09_23835, partial [Candidatus Riflebacteria bacterium]|nr:hypothetical protein [Candidatus Riflebacteria bacterium]